MKHKDQAIAALLSHEAPCDACPARRRCAAELLACHALLIYVETGRAHDPRDFAPPTRGVFASIERPKAMSDRGPNYNLLKLPADKSAWAWAEFEGPHARIPDRRP